MKAMLKQFFGKRQPPRDVQTHKLFRVPVTVTFDIFVAAPSAEAAVSPAVADSSAEYLQNDIQNLIDETSPSAVFRFGVPLQVTKPADIPETYRTAIPYFNPQAPTVDDPYCEDFLPNDHNA
jgi:hypothetical protein